MWLAFHFSDCQVGLHTIWIDQFLFGSNWTVPQRDGRTSSGDHGCVPSDYASVERVANWRQGLDLVVLRSSIRQRFDSKGFYCLVSGNKIANLQQS